MDSEDDCVVSEGHLHPPGEDVTFFLFQKGWRFSTTKVEYRKVGGDELSFLFCEGDFLRILPGMKDHYLGHTFDVFVFPSIKQITQV